MFEFNKVNNKYKNFKVTRYQKIDEIKIELIELVHEKTSSKVIKILNDDDEKLFSFSFKTYPDSSNGAAHILEHTTLCGSEKFPIRDPFFMMLRRSLNTFMNAMTGSDFTCYPASSMLEKDYFNLMEVYLDAIFHPKLNKLDFLQEGHRLEFENPNDPNSLKFKGVVYNEMKGAMSNVDNRIWHKMMEKIMPNLTYAFNSGGEPKEILNLSHSQLLDFHDKFYHPSRCLFFFYGSLDLTKELDFIEENALKNIKQVSDIPPIQKQKRFLKPFNFNEKYPIAENKDLDDKAIITIGFLTTSIENQLELYALQIIDTILMGTDGSYLKRALVESKLVKQVDSLMDNEISEIPYVINLKGCNKNNKDKIVNLINTTLENLIQNDIPKNLIDSALHQLEFSRTEISSEYGPYGLMLFFRSALLKQHGVDIENALVIHTLFKELREKFKNPNYIKELIKKYFLNNNHKVTIIFEPDINLSNKEAIEEKKSLEEIQKKLSKSQIENIIKETQELKKYQETVKFQSKDCLPKIKISEINKDPKNYPLEHEKINSLNLYHHNCFTNDIVYVDLIYDLPKLTLEELDHLSLFANILTEIGSKDRDYIENLEYIQKYTGGIEANISINTDAFDFNSFKPSFIISSKALFRNTQKMFDIIKDIIKTPDFEDKNRIKDILISNYVYLENSLPSHSMKYAIELSRESLTNPSFIDSKLYGIDYFIKLKKIVSDIDKNLDPLIDVLKRLQNKLLLLENATIVLDCSKDNLESLKKSNFYNIEEISKNKFDKFTFDFEIKKPQSQAALISSSVSFNASSYKTIGFTHEDSANLLIASYVMKNNFLHTLIREIGGAYGSSATYSPNSAIFTLSSYRDPHINSTLNAFKTAIIEVSKGNFSLEELEEAKLSIIQKFDSPISPGYRAMSSYGLLKSNKTFEMRKKYRIKLLEAKKEDVIKASTKHMLNQIDEMIISTFTSKELLDKEKPNLAIKNI
ncbi:MAG: hypothetical protein K1060chlam5_00583 [Candidatus Anoxychlamydiales bacterium]|nr:hypothetical protein [Candidatus Anoxychlamydiales bacterium]